MQDASMISVYKAFLFIFSVTQPSIGWRPLQTAMDRQRFDLQTPDWEGGDVLQDKAEGTGAVHGKVRRYF